MDAHMLIPSSINDSTTQAPELIRFSSQATSITSRSSVATRNASLETVVGGKLTPPASTKAKDAQLEDCAAPLAPLREGDIDALASFFERDDAGDIEDDINRGLFWLCPTPPWDDEPVEFLLE